MTNKVKLLLILGIVVVVLGAGTVALLQGGSGNDKQATPSPSSTALRTLSDGGFEFVPIRARCGVAQVGNETLNKKPQGSYCVVMLTVKNVTNQPKLFPEAQQRAVTNDGVQVNADPAAGDFANGDDQTLTQEIGPNTRVAGYIVFDIPRGATLANLELHGDPSSPGVTVPVG